jgi:monoamine oxidase
MVPGITATGLKESERREITQKASFEGVPLYQQGFWSALLRVISSEAYQLGVDAGGYNSIFANWNAADAIPWYLSDFGITPKYKGFKQGFQHVPLSLAQLFRAAGGDIRLQTRLDGFDHNGVFELSIGEQTVRAKMLILAMPRRSLELLMPKSKLLQNEQIQTMIASVTPQPLFKLFTTYSSPWWLPAEVKLGRTVTDLPVRQIYYWPKDDGTPVTSGPAMLMSYDDGMNVGFWESWQAGRTVPASLGSAWEQYQPPKAMRDEVSRQLALIHGLTYAPEVREAAFRYWGADPFGGGWNSWKIGVKSWEVKQQIVQPFSGRELYICGEAYSDGQGWVEGALQTADMMLQKIGVPPI